MPRRILSALIALVALMMIVFFGRSPDGRGQDKPTPKPAGLAKRVPWTTSNVRGSPDPPSPYKTEFAFPKLKFDEPLDLTRLPGTDRIIVTERYGRVFTFRNDPAVEKPDLLLDLFELFGKTAPKSLAAYGFAAHPRFAQNGFVYVTIVPDLSKDTPLGTRVSRYHVPPGDPPRCDPKSEQIIIEWASGGHNGGCLQFGHDGYLYIGTGDASGIADQNQAGQDLTTVAGKMLRIDVDHPDGEPGGVSPRRNYGIPKDNPFINHKGARPEIWAYGLRQPWKFSFDRGTGDLWCGNVGQDLWEQIYRIEPGQNYGWSVTEGSHPFRPERPLGPSPIIMPIVEHDHANFRSITGGFVYHGKRLPALVGAYIYGDYDTGRIWAFRYDRQKKTVSDHGELVGSRIRLVGFAEDAAGELLLLDHMAGRISRLVPNPAVAAGQTFPRKLSETGLFASTKHYRMADGLISYSVIAPQWCDGATKERYLALPGNSQIEFEGILYPGAPGAPPGWKFPDGTVIAETIFLEMEAGKPASRRRLETRILHHQRLAAGTEEVGDQYWQGYTYVWNDEQTDAVLLEDPQGRDQAFSIKDSSTVDGKRQQTWHFPSRNECIMCHNMAAKYAVGMQTAQMNRDHDYGVRPANQLRTFEHIGLFSKPLPAPPEELPRLVDYRDAKQNINLRARSYLHANCSHCHRKWGGGNAEFQLLATFDLADTGTLGVRPNQGTFNIANAKLIAPGDPFRSIVFYRMSTIGGGRMPRLGSSVVDEAGVKLIHDWIAQLPGSGMTTDSAIQESELAAINVSVFLNRFKVGAIFIERVDQICASPGSALRLAHAMADASLSNKLRGEIAARAVKTDKEEVRDLFERFLPEEQRVKRLGAVVRPEQILALPGDVARGRALFFDASGVQCKSCHRIEGKGTEVGPDLDQIGKKYSRAEILENILFPSKQIDPKYLTYRVETKQGQVYRGILVSKDDAKVILKDATNKRIEVPTANVEVYVAEQKSIMPDLLLRDMTAEQVADLTTFLKSLK